MASAQPTLYLASICYGGAAHADFAKALLALRGLCAAKRVSLHMELAGGEALIGRGRAALLAKFLGTTASHLLFLESDQGFDPAEVLRMLDDGHSVVLDGPTLLISRAAAQKITQGYPQLQAKLGDLRGMGAEAVMVFDPLIEPGRHRYLTDKEAFCRRWRDLGGKVAGLDIAAS